MHKLWADYHLQVPKQGSMMRPSTSPPCPGCLSSSYLQLQPFFARLSCKTNVLCTMASFFICHILLPQFGCLFCWEFSEAVCALLVICDRYTLRRFLFLLRILMVLWWCSVVFLHLNRVKSRSPKQNVYVKKRFFNKPTINRKVTVFWK